ncbi:MAG: hypothetical protein ACI4IQ_05245 [Eubacterium sp.]
MKKTINKIIKSTAISIVTLLAGFIITAISFNLFDSLTPNQMKILFAFDVICLTVAGAITLLVSDKKKLQKKQKKARRKIRYQQLLKEEQDFSQLVKIADKSDFAA